MQLKSLWPHQREMVDFAKFQFSEGRGAIWWVGMRFGKTRAALELITEMGFKKVLVVALPHIIDVWQHEVEHWGYDIPVYPLTQPSTKKRNDYLLEEYEEGIVLTNYSGYWRDPLWSTLRDIGFELVVYDECHKLKSAGSKQSRRAHTMHKDIKYHLGLTGTLLPNGKQDIYGTARAIEPRAFGTRQSDFKNKYCILGGFKNYQIVGYRNEDEYHQRMDKIVYNLTDDSLIKGLAPEVTTDVFVKLPPSVMETYRELNEQMVAFLEDGAVSVKNVLVKTIRLVQMTSGFVQYDDGELVTLHDRKLDAAMGWLEELEGEPTIIWTRFIAERDALKELAEKRGHSVSVLDGRYNELGRWKAGETDVLIADYTSGSQGLDLSRAGHDLYYSPTYNRVDFEQAMWRMRGSTQRRKHVFHTLLVARGTIDEAVYDALQNKKEMSEAVIEHLSNKYGG